jgi:hypothetical protein
VNVDPDWLDDELAELARLVETGDTLELVARLNAVVSSPKRLGVEAEETIV